MKWSDVTAGTRLWRARSHLPLPANLPALDRVEAIERHIGTLALCFFLFSPLLRALDRFEAVEPHMGTLARIIVYTSNKNQAKQAFTKAFTRIGQLDDILSDYKPASEINRLCQTRSVIVSPDLYKVLEASQRLAAESGGAFDITAAPLIRLWREVRKTRLLPTTLDQAQGRSGWRKLTLDDAHRKATLAEPGMLLDVGGIAKGYAASEALAAITSTGIESALVALSGDIAVSHSPPGAPGWPITLELAGGTRDITLHDAAVSTAGDTEQFVEIDGVRYSHIIDPRTGQALTTRIAVSVVAPHGLEADGLDTAISVLGVKRGLELMKAHPKAWALIVTEEGVVETGHRP